MSISAWIIPWRDDLRSLLSMYPARRPPALRRSLLEDWLFATDFPRCAEEKEARSFYRQAEKRGWEVLDADGWFHLRRKEADCPENWFPEEPEGEAACLRELLRRHPGSADPRHEIIMLLKAREEGQASWEETCRQLHRQFAGRLRDQEPLPAVRLEKEESEPC